MVITHVKYHSQSPYIRLLGMEPDCISEIAGFYELNCQPTGTEFEGRCPRNSHFVSYQSRNSEVAQHGSTGGVYEYIRLKFPNVRAFTNKEALCIPLSSPNELSLRYEYIPNQKLHPLPSPMSRKDHEVSTKIHIPL